MKSHSRARFRVELALAIASALILALTLVSKEWIEEILGVDPDGGSGALEWGIAVGLLLSTAVFATLARLEWRRLASE